jgi:hypothetical protein
MADGLMSQALANVRSAQQQTAAATGLPSAATPVQSNMVATLQTMIPTVQSAAAAILQAATGGSQPIAAAEAAIEAKDSGAMKAALDSLQASMASVTSLVTNAVTEVQAALTAILADNQTLATIGADLNTQIIKASAEADTATSEADDLDKKKYYWLLLGPFGLVGLATCIGMIVTASNKVNGVRQHVSELRGQAAQWTKIQSDLDLLRHEVPTISSTLLSLQSGLEFLGGDTTEVVADVAKAEGGSPIARAYVITAKHELAILASDAS